MAAMFTRSCIVLSVLPAIFFGGCGGSSTVKCVAGATAECACPGGKQGVQTCNSAGVFGTCVCGATPTTDAGGGDSAVASPPDARAVGGRGGSGGAGGAGGSVADAVPDLSATNPPDAPAVGGSGGSGGAGGVGGGRAGSPDAAAVDGRDGTAGTSGLAGTTATGGTTGSGGTTNTGGTTSTGGASGTGGTSAVCQGSATQCSGNSVQTCTNGQWGEAIACGTRQTCAGPVGTAKCTCNVDPVCSSVGGTCAST